MWRTASYISARAGTHPKALPIILSVYSAEFNRVSTLAALFKTKLGLVSFKIWPSRPGDGDRMGRQLRVRNENENELDVSTADSSARQTLDSSFLPLRI
jgi:hypothetical protein